jgi:hypothetical protein
VRVQVPASASRVRAPLSEATLTGEMGYDYRHHLARRIDRLIVLTGPR